MAAAVKQCTVVSMSGRPQLVGETLDSLVATTGDAAAARRSGC